LRRVVAALDEVARVHHESIHRRTHGADAALDAAFDAA
jgi:hypothetical protein